MEPKSCGPGPVLVPAAWPRDPGPGSRPGPMGPWVHGPYQILKETYQILKETYPILKETYQILNGALMGPLLGPGSFCSIPTGSDFSQNRGSREISSQSANRDRQNDQRRLTKASETISTA